MLVSVTEVSDRDQAEGPCPGDLVAVWDRRLNIAHPGMVSKPGKTPNWPQFSNSPWTAAVQVRNALKKNQSSLANAAPRLSS